MTFQIGYIISDALFRIRERKEVNSVDVVLVGFGAALLEHFTEFMVLKGEHTAVGMVDNGEFVRADELLRNNEGAEGFLAIRRGSKSLGKLEGSTYAAPPALRMICASPCLMPRAAAGLVNQSRSVQLSRYREFNCPYSIRQSMQVTTANLLAGVIESDPCRSRLSDGSLVQRRGPNLFSEVLYILLIISEELMDVVHVSFSQDGSENQCSRL